MRAHSCSAYITIYAPRRVNLLKIFSCEKKFSKDFSSFRNFFRRKSPSARIFHKITTPKRPRMEVDEAPSSSTVAVPAKADKKRFEIKKWSAVALWAWDIVVGRYWNLSRSWRLQYYLITCSFLDNCAICRNHIMDLCIECQANQASHTSEVTYPKDQILHSKLTLFYYLSGILHYHNFCSRSVPLLGECVTMPSISIVFHDGSKPGRSVPLTTETGNSKSTAVRRRSTSRRDSFRSRAGIETFVEYLVV